MKTLKLNALEKETMTNREMHQLKGGGRTCRCACLNHNQGVSDMDNGNANFNAGIDSPKGEIQIVVRELEPVVVVGKQR